MMEAKAVVMGLLGFFLLFGGLTACVAIAWYHGRQQDRRTSDRAHRAGA